MMNVVDSMGTAVSVTAESIAAHVELRIGESDQPGSRCAKLKPADARIMAYALLLSAERVEATAKEAQLQAMLDTEVRREGR
jgi:hypothetical protein